jgi:uncharacterized membrane protein
MCKFVDFPNFYLISIERKFAVAKKIISAKDPRMYFSHFIPVLTISLSFQIAKRIKKKIQKRRKKKLRRRNQPRSILSKFPLLYSSNIIRN